MTPIYDQYDLEAIIECSDMCTCLTHIRTLPEAVKANHIDQARSKIEKIGTAMKRIKDTESNENVKNEAYLFEVYSRTWSSYIDFWLSFKQREYDESWIHLQQTIEKCDLLWRHLKNIDDLRLKEFMTHLKMWELMYPYKVFASPKYIVHKKECSICGRDWRDAKCMHIPGRIYGGELMNYKVKENEMLEISVVENPEDKKLLIKPETGYEPGFFRDLDAIQRYNNKPLQKLEVYGEFREGVATKSLILNGQRMYLYDMTLIGFRQLHVQWYAESIDLRPQI